MTEITFWAITLILVQVALIVLPEAKFWWATRDHRASEAKIFADEAAVSERRARVDGPKSRMSGKR